MKRKASRWIVTLLCIACMMLAVACSKETVKEPTDPNGDSEATGLTVTDYQEYDYDQNRLNQREDMKFHGASSTAGGTGNQTAEETPADNEILKDPEFHFLNGEGGEDCTVVVLPNGKILLYNVGSSDEAFGTYLRSYLEGMHVKKIDYIVLSDYDDGRIGQLGMLATDFDTSKAMVYVKGKTMKDNDDKPIREEMKALQTMDSHAYDNFMSVMRIFREAYGDVTFIDQENASLKVGGMNLDFFNMDYSSYKDYRDWTLCCRMSYNNASVTFLGGATSEMLNSYASKLEKSNVIRVSGHQKDYYGKEFYTSVAADMTVSQLPEATAKNTLTRSWLQNLLQEKEIDSYVTGMSGSEIVIRLTGGRAKVINGVIPTVIEFEGFWTDWID